ncbi:hypothetical protein [Scytonema tolypothrichoides]
MQHREKGELELSSNTCRLSLNMRKHVGWGATHVRREVAIGGFPQ